MIPETLPTAVVAPVVAALVAAVVTMWKRIEKIQDENAKQWRQFVAPLKAVRGQIGEVEGD